MHSCDLTEGGRKGSAEANLGLEELGGEVVHVEVVHAHVAILAACHKAEAAEQGGEGGGGGSGSPAGDGLACGWEFITGVGPERTTLG